MSEITKYEFHPAVLELPIPMWSDKKLREYADDLKKKGFIPFPLIILDGKILDGRNRYEACKLAGIEPSVQQYSSPLSPTEFVLATLQHRDLSVGERVKIGVAAEEILAEQAKERQRVAAENTNAKSVNSTLVVNLPQAEIKRQSRPSGRCKSHKYPAR